MNIREEVDKALDALPEGALEGVLEYIRLITGPPEVEPTEGKCPLAIWDSGVIGTLSREELYDDR